MEKVWIGAHTSAAGGAPQALLEGRQIGASAIQLFTSNQKQWNGRAISKDEIDLWQKLLSETGISEVMSHDSYLINLGSPNPELLSKSRKAFAEEIQRCHQLEIPYLNFHPGAATTGSVEQCLEMIAERLLLVGPLVLKGKTLPVLELTAGQGTSVGYKFEHIGEILRKIDGKIPLGVCIDTCHIFAAGYDIRTPDAWEKTLQEFDEKIGLKYLKAFHLNDSQKDLGSRVDRHAPIGEGKIGLEAFQFVMQDPRTRHLPKYLETPDGPPGWTKEIALLRNFANEN